MTNPQGKTTWYAGGVGDQVVLLLRGREIELADLIGPHIKEEK